MYKLNESQLAPLLHAVEHLAYDADRKATVRSLCDVMLFISACVETDGSAPPFPFNIQKDTVRASHWVDALLWVSELIRSDEFDRWVANNGSEK